MMNHHSKLNDDSPATGGVVVDGEGQVLSRSPRVAARQAEARRRILEAARTVVSEQGFAAAQVAVVASIADVATGSIYRHFPSKASLFSEMLRHICRRELEVVRAILEEDGRSAAERIGDAVATFVDRALRGGGLSYAVIVEPVDPDIDQVRLDARAGLAAAFARVIQEGIADGELGDQDPHIRGAAIVGAFLEGVVAPLAARPVDAARRDEVSHEIAAFCQNAVTGAALTRGASA
jgi:AcrR family transcriptional regulator